MSNMFLGTALTKPNQQQQQQQQQQQRGLQREHSQQQQLGEAASQQPHVKEAFSLDELDRPENCPESVDLESWKLTCALRRKKIASEECIKAAAADLLETEEVI